MFSYKFFFFIVLSLMLIGFGARANLLGGHNIDTNERGFRWIWNDLIGWVDFHANYSVSLTENQLLGWAESAAVGEIVFDCSSVLGGSVCGTVNFGVRHDGGDLFGWAWNEVLGWISFSCENDHDSVMSGTQSVCGTTGNYGVSLREGGGGEFFFKGWAWSEVVGWLSFSCDNQFLCLTMPTYLVQAYLSPRVTSGAVVSQIFDTQSTSPTYNYIIWQGQPATDSIVYLQLASADQAAGPWQFDELAAASVNRHWPIAAAHQGKRYIRYRLSISLTNSNSASPVIEDVVINYSR